MSVMTIEGVVDNGQIKLEGDVRLPDKTRASYLYSLMVHVRHGVSIVAYKNIAEQKYEMVKVIFFDEI